jgi:hypothetical protein
VKCVGCGYSLDGLKVRCCPECGLAQHEQALLRERQLLRSVRGWAFGGLGAASIQLGMVFLGSGAGAAEPFRDFIDYGWAVLKMSAIGGVVAIIPLGVVFAAVAWIAPFKLRAIALCVFACAPISALYTGARCLVYMRQASFGFLAGKPGWIDFPVWGVLARESFLWPGWLVCVLVVVWILRRSDRE